MHIFIPFGKKMCFVVFLLLPSLTNQSVPESGKRDKSRHKLVSVRMVFDIDLLKRRGIFMQRNLPPMFGGFLI